MAFQTRSRRTAMFLVFLALLLSTVACGLPLATGSPTGTPEAPTLPPLPTAGEPSATLPPTATATQTTAPTLTQEAQPQPTATSPAPTATRPAAPSPTNTRAPAELSEVTIFLIAVGDNGLSGPKIGCDDSLVAVRQPIEPTSGVIRASLNRLFSFKEQTIGESGLYSALWQSDLALTNARVDSGVATVYLEGQLVLGGVCDSPRVKAQIVETILAQPGVTAANVFINSVPIDEALSQQ